MKMSIPNVPSVNFKCDICDYKVKQKSNLKKHTTIVHEQKKPFKCQICSTRLASKQNCKKNHISDVHFRVLYFKKLKL